MKNKTLFSIRLAAANRSFEMWVPDELSIYEATQLIIGILQEQESRRFKADRSTSLYHEDSGTELDVDKLVGEYNFVDGTQLVLV